MEVGDLRRYRAQVLSGATRAGFPGPMLPPAHAGAAGELIE